MVNGYFSDCTALVTGASAGLGREFARQLAPSARALVIVARRQDRLQSLEEELKIINPELTVHARVVDLRDHNQVEAFCDWLDQSGLTIDCLINNAGLGDRGEFGAGSWERVHAMLAVNIEALTYLTFRLLPGMRRIGGGAILNVSSIAGLLPVPRLGVYAATKAYVNSFTESLRAELRFTNITVTTVCPGPVPTEFEQVSRRGSARYQSPEFLIVAPQEVVRAALTAVRQERARVIPGINVRMAMTVAAFIPLFVLRLVYDWRRSMRPAEAPGSQAVPAES
ncbi:MAG: SDR family oxidoreductase [Verrucomicrobia bacterium]|nr:SDR family oxidoreductase [Verrucomicrobiota bacterium]